MKLLILPFSSSYKVLIWQWHAAQGGAGITIPGDAQEPRRYGTEGRGYWAWRDELIVRPDDLRGFLLP